MGSTLFCNTPHSALTPILCSILEKVGGGESWWNKIQVKKWEYLFHLKGWKWYSSSEFMLLHFHLKLKWSTLKKSTVKSIFLFGQNCPFLFFVMWGSWSRSLVLFFLLLFVVLLILSFVVRCSSHSIVVAFVHPTTNLHTIFYVNFKCFILSRH